MTVTISNTDDVIDLRDVINRVEELEEIDGIEDLIDNLTENDDAKELVMLREFLGECQGYGGDEQWRGDWYPVTAIRDSYFTDYTQQLLEDIGDLPKDIPHYIAIDWEATAKNIQVDYTGVEFDGVTYWVR